MEIFPHQVVDEKVCERANAEDRRSDEGKSIDTRIAAVGVSVKDSREDGGDERDEENNLKIKNLVDKSKIISEKFENCVKKSISSLKKVQNL